MIISLDNIKMTVIQTDPNGIVNDETIFIFSQQQDVVHGAYAGGKINKGFLVGKSDGQTLNFSYSQLQTNGELDCGLSTCELTRNETGKIILTERFEWKSRPGEFGVNIFMEI
ncbi:MAG: hypothetical protein ACOYXT_07845 [Bacteroidota bacterium]